VVYDDVDRSYFIRGIQLVAAKGDGNGYKETNGLWDNLFDQLGIGGGPGICQKTFFGCLETEV
jgi:hypothetical protein